jgi:hypothetical protein
MDVRSEFWFVIFVTINPVNLETKLGFWLNAVNMTKTEPELNGNLSVTEILSSAEYTVKPDMKLGLSVINTNYLTRRMKGITRIGW